MQGIQMSKTHAYKVALASATLQITDEGYSR